MPFIIGDKVIVYRKFAKEGSSFIWISPDMDKAIGKEGTVKKIPKSKTCPTYAIEFDDPNIQCKYWFHEDSLAPDGETANELAKEEKERQARLNKLNAFKPEKEVHDFLKKYKSDSMKKYKAELATGQSEEYFAPNDDEALKLMQVKYRNNILNLHVLVESSLLEVRGNPYPAS
jgi:hypothetical protein